MRKILENLIKKSVTFPETKPVKTQNQVINNALLNASQHRGKLPKIGLVIDATGSRSYTWKAAQVTQAKMFTSLQNQNSALALQVTYYGGASVHSSPWYSSGNELNEFMQAVKCKAGFTQIAKSLSLYLTESQNLKAVCLIGDTAEIKESLFNKAMRLLTENDFYHDSKQDLETISKNLGAKGVRVFTFLDGQDKTGREVFQMIARNSGGAFASFGSKNDLSEMCNFVASFAALDAQDFKKLIGGNSSKQVKNLAQQLAISYQNN